ncbi:MAG: hypothetical protein QOE89_2128, partial [Pseudonocardiales bacterium]|nr:hypothetical protein [Pseudonocardiales bacterium]
NSPPSVSVGHAMDAVETLYQRARAMHQATALSVVPR